jgi:hypothetical protein
MAYNSNTDLLMGNNVMVYLGNSGSTQPLAFAQDCKLSITSTMVDATNKFSGNAKVEIPGQYSWTITSNVLVTKVSGDTSFDTLLATQLSGGSLNIILGVPSDQTSFALTGAGMYTGTVHIASLDMDSKDNAICTSSITFNGSGALTHVLGS